MNLPDHIDAEILLHNNSPVDDFLGLTANQIHDLLYDPLGLGTVVQFHDNIEPGTLDQVPLFLIAEAFLKIIQRDNHIKLTPLGALPKKVMVELYSNNFLPDEFIESGITKLWKEDDCISIRSARLTTEIAGLVKKANGKLTLTKATIKLLDTGNRVQLFKRFFQAFTDKFLWSFNDGYPEQPIGQLGWAFSVLMLDRFGDKPRNATFYAQKYLTAFPAFLECFQPVYATVEEQFYHCYGTRTITRFFLWFGFVTTDKRERFLDIDTASFTRTAVPNGIFKVENS